MSSNETIIAPKGSTSFTANGTARFAGLSQHRYMIEGAFGTGQINVFSFSPALDAEVLTEHAAIIADEVFFSSDPYLSFVMTGATGGEDVNIVATPTISRDRSI